MGIDLRPYRLVHSGKLASHSSIGSYPLLYLDSHYEVLCAECAEEEAADPDSDGIAAVGVHWEGPPETCSNCDKEIESAYGEVEE